MLGSQCANLRIRNATHSSSCPTCSLGDLHRKEHVLLLLGDRSMLFSTRKFFLFESEQKTSPFSDSSMGRGEPATWSEVVECERTHFKNSDTRN